MDQLQGLKDFLQGFRKLVIIGLGNPLDEHDNAGIRVVRGLKGKIRRKDVVIIDAEAVLENFLGPVVNERPSHLLIIDAAILDENATDGWKLLDPELMDSAFHSTHSLPISLFCKAVQTETRCSSMGIGILPGDASQLSKLSALVYEILDGP